MNGNPGRRALLADLAWRGTSTVTLAGGVFTGGELALNYGALAGWSRLTLAGIVAIDIGLYVALRLVRRRDARRAGPRRYTVTHPAGNGEAWTQTAWDARLGSSIPVRGLGSGEVTGRIVAARVAEDGASVELTLDVPGGGSPRAGFVRARAWRGGGGRGGRV